MINLQLSVPYSIQFTDKSMYNSTIAIFEDIPSENDIHKIIECQHNFGLKHPNSFVMSFGKYLVLSAKYKGGIYYLSHDSSIDDLFSNFYIDKYSSYEDFVKAIKQLIEKDLEQIEGQKDRLERIVKSN